jgi:RecB family exonuclease
MSLTLWTEHGPGYRSAAYFARIAQTLARMDRPAIYVVPNSAWKARSETLCLPHCDGILFGERIVTLKQWLENMAGSTTPCISPMLRNHIIAQVAATLPLDYFRGAKATDLLAQGIVAALAAGILPPQLTQLAADFGQEREHDLAMVYEAYFAHLAQSHRVDTAQIPSVALHALSNQCPLSHSRFIIETGNEPPAILWPILRVLMEHHAAPDVHVIIPEILQHAAEGHLGIEAQEISPEEWIATSSPAMTLYRAPNLSAEYQWMSQHLRQLHTDNTPPHSIGVLCCDPDPTFWLEACTTSPALKLAASPISAPWHSDRIWDRAPATATLTEWIAYWKSQLAPAARVQSFVAQISHSAAACRALQDIARWEEIWMHCMAAISADQAMSQRELQAFIAPTLQDPGKHCDTSALYTEISLHAHVGDRLSHLLVMDATQDLLPRVAPSPFFKLAASFPQDPSAQTLIAAFPNSEKIIQTQMAAWQRLQGCAETTTGIYSQSSDSRGDVFPSLFLDVDSKNIQDVPVTELSIVSPEYTPAFLNDADTIAHMRNRLRDHVFSITELETFAACPFRHFARYILGVTIPDEDTPEIPAKDEGKIIHRLLEHYYRHPLHTDDSTAIQAHLTTILARDIRTTTPLHQIQIHRLITRATAAILRDLNDAKRLGPDALQPTHLEWQFGYDEVPPLKLQDAEGRTAAIRGKIDRIDIHPTQKRLLLLDYKYRAADPIGGEIQKGQHLQIPLYLMAVQKLFSDHVVLGALLYDLPNTERRHGIARKDEADFLGIPGRPKSLVKPETWDQLLETASAYALQYATQIRGAEIPIPPHRCAYCDWKDLLPWETEK